MVMWFELWVEWETAFSERVDDGTRATARLVLQPTSLRSL